jgi:YD repeat-containing protein
MRISISQFAKAGLLAAIGLLAIPAVSMAQDTTIYAYDSNYVLLGTPLVISGAASAITHQYDANSNVILDVSVPNPILGDSSLYLYDPAGNVLSSTTASGTATSSAYDSDGDKIAVTDVAGSNSSLWTYDNMGNQLSMTNVSGDVTASAYDTLNNRIALTEADPLGNSSTWTYDTMGNQITMIDTPGSPDVTAYDPIGGLLSVTTYDGNGNTITHNYDAANSYNPVGSLTDPGFLSSMTYDPNGNMIESVIDANGRSTIFQYDPAGNVLTPTATLPGDVVGMTYDTLNDVLYVAVVPEPASLAMIGLASLSLLRRRYRGVK